jgi:hypothetical protein
VGFEKAGLPQGRRHERTRKVARLPIDVAIRRVVPDLAGRDALPEDSQSLEATLRRIAGNDRRVDAADRNAADPVRLHALLVQGLIDAGLIGAERATTLQDKGYPVAPVRPPSGCNNGIRTGRSRVHDFSFEFLIETAA